jgi:hypothetical protein
MGFCHHASCATCLPPGFAFSGSSWHLATLQEGWDVVCVSKGRNKILEIKHGRHYTVIFAKLLVSTSHEGIEETPETFCEQGATQILERYSRSCHVHLRSRTRCPKEFPCPNVVGNVFSQRRRDRPFPSCLTHCRRLSCHRASPTAYLR